ncbi:hypothetical protein [Desulfosarcina widdelii]|uniref:hypothetical protein n=1 Tax=Desulfosarcina widdelii TaxID=947919 RepID=UPI0012D2FF25|nr:hypothetical protein [Desulfosarcina widdelii]
MDDHDLYLHVLTSQIEMKEWKRIRRLVDCRSIQGIEKITFQGLQRACEIQVEEYGDRDYRCAILINADKHRTLAEFAAHMLRSGNLKINVIEDGMDAALEWLGYDESTAGYLKGKIKRNVRVFGNGLPK